MLVTLTQVDSRLIVSAVFADYDKDFLQPVSRLKQFVFPLSASGAHYRSFAAEIRHTQRRFSRDLSMSCFSYRNSVVGSLWLLGAALMGVCASFGQAQPAAPAQPSPAEALVMQAVDEYDAEKHGDVDAAVQSLREGDLAGARSHLAEAVKKDPRLPPARFMTAQLMLAINQPNLARGELEGAITEAPNDPDAYLLAARIAIAERRFAEGELLCARAMKLLDSFKGGDKRKKNAEIVARSGMSAIYQAREKWDKAVEQLQACIKLDDKNAPLYQDLGVAYFKLAKMKESQAAYQNAYKLNSDLPSPELQLANQYELAGDHANGKKMVEAAIKKSPKDAKILLNAARWAIMSGEFQLAKQHVDAVLKNDPESLDATLMAGAVARQMKDSASAIKHFEKAHLKSPNNFTAMNELALLYAEKEDDDKRRQALEFAALNAQKNNQNSIALATLGWVLHNVGRENDAVQSMMAAVKAGQLTQESAYYMAVVLEKNGNNAEARAFLETTLSNKQPFPVRDNAEKLLAKIKGDSESDKKN